MFIKRVVNKFTHFGTVSDLRRRYIPTQKHTTDQQISAVKKRYSRRQRLSTRRAALELSMSRYTIRKILKKYLKKRPWKPYCLEKLQITDAQKLRRVTQARKILRIPRLLTFLADVWFTDESWFTGEGIAQNKNTYYWALTRDAVKPVRFQKHTTKVHVWATILVRGIIGPYFFHADEKKHVCQSIYISDMF